MDTCYLLPRSYETDRTYAYEIDDIMYVYYNIAEHEHADRSVFGNLTIENTSNEGVVIVTNGLPSAEEMYERIVSSVSDNEELEIICQSWPRDMPKTLPMKIIKEVFSPVVPDNEFLLIDCAQGRFAEPCTSEYWCLKIWASPVADTPQTGYSITIPTIDTDALGRQVFEYIENTNSKPVIIDGLVLAQVIGKSIYIHFDIFSSYNYSVLPLFKIVLDEAIKVVNGKEYVLRNLYAERLEYLLSGQQRIKKNELDDLLLTIQDLVRALNGHHERRSFLMAEIESMKGDRLRKKIDYELNLINANINVVSFSVNGNRLMFTTNMMSFVVDNEKYNVGYFLVSVDLGGGSVIFNNKTQLVSGGYQDKMHAPHVFSDGTACFGNIGASVTKLISNQELAAVVDLLCAFLSSVNVTDAAGKYYHLWPLASETE